MLLRGAGDSPTHRCTSTVPSTEIAAPSESHPSAPSRPHRLPPATKRAIPLAITPHCGTAQPYTCRQWPKDTDNRHTGGRNAPRWIPKPSALAKRLTNDPRRSRGDPLRNRPSTFCARTMAPCTRAGDERTSLRRPTSFRRSLAILRPGTAVSQRAACIYSRQRRSQDIDDARTDCRRRQGRGRSRAF